jgi:hypothetical protein
MTSAPIHPAASHAFLSRLHDGELSPAEAARFQSHRETCAGCREAVDTFERALAVYRAAPTGAPSSDLSARILRKVRAQSPSRRPFGVTFGIDMRWAGAMVAAILVALVAAPILLRKGVPRSSAPIPVVLDSRAEPGAAAKTAETDEKVPETAPSAPARAAAAPPAPRQAMAASPEEKDAAKKAEASDRFAAAAPSMAGRVAAPELAAPAARAREDAPEKMGDLGELAASPSAEVPNAHLSIRALDGKGQPPAIASRIPAAQLERLRGQSFEVLVGADGVVQEVISPEPGANAIQKKKDGTEALGGLRFAAGEAPRRLLLRIE